MGKSFNTGNLTNIIGYNESNVAITGSVNISGTVVSTGTSLVSGSGQISYTGITNIPSGIVSGSAQTIANLPSGVVSGSNQTIANLPSGVVSGSVQVTTFGFGTTGSNTFQGSQTINGSLVVTGSLTAQQFIVSSSVTYLTESFASGSHKFGDSSDDTHQFTGSVLISGSILATGTSLVSGSSQVDVMSTTNIARLATTGSNVFTGAITGTTATFSGAITSKDVYITNSANADVLEIFQSPSVLNSFIDYPSGRSLILRNKGTAGGLTLASTGAATFSGNGAFSGVLQVAPTQGTGIIGVGDSFGGGMNAGIYRGGLGVTTTGNYLNIGGYDGVVITTGAAALGSQTVRLTIASTGAATFSSSVAATAADANVGLRVIGGTGRLVIFPYYDATNGVLINSYNTAESGYKPMSFQASAFIFSQGAATFNGNVTVGSAIAATNVEFNLSGVSGKAKRIQFQDGVTNQWLLGQGAASETSAFELYNATGTIVLSVNKTSNLSTFGNSVQILKDTNTNGTNIEEINMGLTVLSSSGQSKIAIGACNAGNYGYVQVMQDATSWSTRDLTLQPRGGKVGIGVYNPLTLFHTYSATDNLSTFQAGSSSGIQLRFRHGSTLTGFINSNTTNIFSVYNTNSTELVSVTPGGDVFHYGATSNQGLWTHVQVGSCTGQNTFNFDVTVGDEGGSGNIFKVEAGFAHYCSMSYNCMAEFYISTRGTCTETTDVIRRDSAFGGSFTATKSDAATLRVTKNAGTYPGGGKYWIRVTKVTY